MFCRYDQDLTPFFAKLQEEKRARREERREERRAGWEQLRAALGLRRATSEPARTGSNTHTR